jgi:hypothetical protein
VSELIIFLFVFLQKTLFILSFFFPLLPSKIHVFSVLIDLLDKIFVTFFRNFLKNLPCSFIFREPCHKFSGCDAEERTLLSHAFHFTQIVAHVLHVFKAKKLPLPIYFVVNMMSQLVHSLGHLMRELIRDPIFVQLSRTEHPVVV